MEVKEASVVACAQQARRTKRCQKWSDVSGNSSQKKVSCGNCGIVRVSRVLWNQQKRESQRQQLGLRQVRTRPQLERRPSDLVVKTRIGPNDVDSYKHFPMPTEEVEVFFNAVRITTNSSDNNVTFGEQEKQRQQIRSHIRHD